MAPVGWLINPDWAPTVVGANADPDRPSDLERRSESPPMRYATIVKRDPLLRDFFSKLELFADFPKAPLAEFRSAPRLRLRDLARLH